MKITNFEYGSVEIRRDKVTLQIPKTNFKYDNINELNEIQNEREDFLELSSFEESENKERVVFQYILPKDLKSLQKIKTEDLIVKLSIAIAILKRDPLNESDVFTSIHPSTLFYRPMSTVKYTYQANDLMPNEKSFSNFERYKALVVAIISGLTYENCLNNKERVLKANNKLLNAVLATKTKDELLIDLEEHLDYEQYKHFNETDNRNKKAKTRTIIIAATSFLLIFSAIGVTKTVSDKNMNEAIGTYEKEIKVKDEELKTQVFLAEGEYVKAAKSMEKSGVENEDISKMFIDAGLYQEALDANPKSLELVIQDIYDKDERESILELNLAESRDLELEKKIVAYDFAALKNEVSFIENEKQAVRMGKAFVERGDVEEARLLVDRFDSKELEKSIALYGKENELKKTQDALAAVKKQIGGEKDDAKKKDLVNQEKTHAEKIAALEKEIEELKK